MLDKIELVSHEMLNDADVRFVSAFSGQLR